jgi:hypothetical protein
MSVIRRYKELNEKESLKKREVKELEKIVESGEVMRIMKQQNIDIVKAEDIFIKPSDIKLVAAAAGVKG